MEVLFGLWIVCGLGAAAVASSKGRSGCGWLILGFLLGPLGLLISAGMSNLTQAEAIERLAQQRAEESASLRTCPQCAERIQMAARKCRFCGAEVTPIQPPAPPNSGGYDLGRLLGRHFSAWWLLGFGVVLVLAVKSCGPA